MGKAFRAGVFVLRLFFAFGAFSARILTRIIRRMTNEKFLAFGACGVFKTFGVRGRDNDSFGRSRERFSFFVRACRTRLNGAGNYSRDNVCGHKGLVKIGWRDGRRSEGGKSWQELLRLRMSKNLAKNKVTFTFFAGTRKRRSWFMITCRNGACKS